MIERIPPVLRFTLGMIIHPTQIVLRLRELRKILSVRWSTSVSSVKELPEVSLVKVTTVDENGHKLVGLYRRNPSPFLGGQPKTIERLAASLADGMEYYLVLNAQGDIVAARAFHPKHAMSLQLVTDFSARGKGYQQSALALVCKMKAKEGYRELGGLVMKGNIRSQRYMLNAGWKLEPMPNNPDMLRARLPLNPPSRESAAGSQ